MPWRPLEHNTLAVLHSQAVPWKEDVLKCLKQKYINKSVMW